MTVKAALNTKIINERPKTANAYMSMGSYSRRAYYRMIFANEIWGNYLRESGGGGGGGGGGGLLWNFTVFSCRKLCYAWPILFEACAIK